MNKGKDAINPTVAAIILVVVLIVVVGGGYMLFVRSSSPIQDKETVFQRPAGAGKPSNTASGTGSPAPSSGAVTGGGGITAQPGSHTSPFAAH